MLRSGMRVRVSMLTLAAVAAFAFWVGLAHNAATAAAGTGGPIAWGASKTVDRAGPFAESNEIYQLSCGTQPLCVGITGFGDIVSATDPTATSASDWSLLPTSLLSGQATGYALNAVSCAPSGMDFCVVQGGELDPPYHDVAEASSDPSAGKSAWTRTTVPGGGPLLALQCPVAGTCFAINYYGNFLTYTAGAWNILKSSGTPYPLSTTTSLTSLSCPTTSLCVALDTDGRAFITTAPETLSTASWAVTSTGLSAGGSLSCLTASYCVATDDDGNIAASSDPQDGTTSTWTTYTPPFSPAYDPEYAPYLLACSADASLTPGGSFCLTSAGSKEEPYTSVGGGQTTFTQGTLPASLAAGAPGGYGLGVTSIGCADATLCVIGSGGDVTSSTDPTDAGTATWSSPLLVAPGLNQIYFGPQSCPSSKLCIGTDGVGRLYTGTPRFKEGNLRSDAYATAAACPTDKLCVASLTLNDGDTLIASSTDPARGVKSWKLTRSIGQFGGLDLSCTSKSFCYSSSDGDVITSRDPAGGTSKWKAADIDGDHYIFQLVCASDKVCVGVDETGRLLTTSDPTGGKSHWKLTKLSKDFKDLNSIVCPSAKLCVASDGQYVATSTDPGKASSWKRTKKLGSDYISQLTCSSDDLCLGVGYGPGRFFVSTDPKHGSWKVYDAPDAAEFPSDPTCDHGVCALTLASGEAVESSNPAGGTRTWKRIAVPSDKGVTEVTCYNSGVCVAPDGNGDVSEGPVHH